MYLINSRIKRSNQISTLVEAVAEKDFTYWLSQEDIAHIARLEYNNYLVEVEAQTRFEIIGSISHLENEIRNFLSSTKEFSPGRLTLIINLANLHWVTLVISYQNDKYVGYYVDSKDNPLSSEYYELLLKHQIQPMCISPGFAQQSDDYNCGLWALENAANINRMLNENLPLYQLVYELSRPRSKNYFDKRRIFFATKLFNDPTWRQVHPMFHQEIHLPEKMSISLLGSHHSANIQQNPKRFKINSNSEKVLFLLEVFSKTFILEFTKSLAVYNLIAKGEMLSLETFKTELKTGVTGALLGIGISQSIVGSIPSLVASLRILFNKYYLPNKKKAQQITKIFSELSAAGSLAPILSEAAVDIFYNFESQFMQITDKAGDIIAMQKLAEDAVQRSLNYIGNTKNIEDLNGDIHPVILKKIIERGVLSGPSEKFFDPSLKKNSSNDFRQYIER